MGLGRQVDPFPLSPTSCMARVHLPPNLPRQRRLLWNFHTAGLWPGVSILQPSSASPLHPQIPLVPLTPALSILLNICLMLKLSYLTWLRFIFWLLVGEWGPGLHRPTVGGQGGQVGLGPAPQAHAHSCRTHRVFWLRDLAQQGEPEGATGADDRTLCGVPQWQPGGNSAGCAACWPGPRPGGGRLHGVAGQPVRLPQRGPPHRPHRRPGLAAVCPRKLGFEAFPDWAGRVVSSQEVITG